MTNQKRRSDKQILNIGETVDLDGYGMWAQVESWDESSNTYWVTDRLGVGYEYVHGEFPVNHPDNWKDARLEGWRDEHRS